VKVVLDTNVLLAAFATRGLCEALFVVLLQGHEIVFSEYILTELRRHLDAKLKMSKRQIRDIEQLLRDSCTPVSPIEITVPGLNDLDDLPVLGTAVACGADALVTGDAELLGLLMIREIPILSPRQLYDSLCT